MGKQVDGIKRMLLILTKLRTAGTYVPRDELLGYVNDNISRGDIYYVSSG